MSLKTPLFRPLNTIPRSVLIAVAPFIVVAVILTIIRLYTTVRYRSALSDHASARDKSSKASTPPAIPYTIPFLGHANAFLAPRPGEFWANLFRFHPRKSGACTLLLGGNITHILFSPSAVQALFKNRGLARDGFNLQIAVKGLGVDHKEGLRYFGLGEGADHTGVTPVAQQEHMNHKYLLERKGVNELTAEFTRVLVDEVASELKGTGGEGGDREVGLYAWLQDRMFNASTTAFMGSRLLETYPYFRKDFFDFDRYMLTMFFGLPKWLKPTAYNIRENVLSGLVEWQQKMQEECNSDPTDPDGEVDWEPVFGSRANRAKQRYYASRGMSNRSRAALDLGFLFGLSSNAIPATGWMLLHILDPKGDKSLLDRVMQELESIQRDDGTLDIPKLVALPLLHSVFHEVLRLYVDLLVTRELKEDLTLPLDDGKRQVLLEKDSVVMAPSWLGQRDETSWENPPAHQFFAERFLQTDSVTGKPVFSTSGTNGKFFPFGGGKTICPGRVFAKQEVLASVALVLLAFDFEPVGFVDEQGRSRKDFPGLRQTYSGSGVLAMDGDMRVRIKKRNSGSRHKTPSD